VKQAIDFLLVIVIISTIIVTKFFINPAFYIFLAKEAFFAGNLSHINSFRNLKYRKLSVYKRLYTFIIGSKRLKTDSGFLLLPSLPCQFGNDVAQIDRNKKS
jgi:hypothetical protein